MNSSFARYQRLLRAYLLPHWRLASLLGVLLLATIALQLANPQILRDFIDATRTGSGLQRLTFLAVLFLGVALLTQIVSVCETYVAENLGWIATNRLRTDLCLHCLRLDPSFFNDRTPGELIERIDGDVTLLSNFFSRFVVSIFGNGVLILGVLILLFRIDWRVGTALGLFTLCAVFIIGRLQGLAVPFWRESRQASAEMVGFLEERLAGTEDVRSSGAVAYVMGRFHERSRRLLTTTRNASGMGGAVFGTTSLLFWIGMAIALGMGAYLFHAHTATIGTVYLIFAYTQMMTQPIDQIMRQLQDFQQAAASTTRVQQILDTHSALLDGPIAHLPTGPLSVDFDRVSFAYEEDEPVLHDIAFYLEPGKVLGVLGRTGSGKTTLSRLVFRLYDPEAGSVRLGGTDLREMRISGVRERVGMVTQDIQLFHATVRDNLTFFDRAIPDERIIGVLEDLEMWDWCRGLPLGLDTMLSSSSSALSAGEAQLLAFARVFLKDPGLVVLDEASSRLDPATERRIEHAVDRLLEGRTGIIIAHRLGTVRRVDEILVLEDGRILEYGDREALARNPDSRFAHLLRVGLEEVLV